MTRDRAQPHRHTPSLKHRKDHSPEHESPELRGFRVSDQLFCFSKWKPGTPPAIPL